MRIRLALDQSGGVHRPHTAINDICIDGIVGDAQLAALAAMSDMNLTTFRRRDSRFGFFGAGLMYRFKRFLP